MLKFNQTLVQNYNPDTQVLVSTPRRVSAGVGPTAQPAHFMAPVAIPGQITMPVP